VSAALASAALPLVALPALAADGVREISPSTTRMGGLLDAFSDISKGFSVYKPSTWNKFDGTPGEYEAKWQDLIGYTEQIIVRARPKRWAERSPANCACARAPLRPHFARGLRRRDVARRAILRR